MTLWGRLLRRLAAELERLAAALTRWSSVEADSKAPEHWLNLVRTEAPGLVEGGGGVVGTGVVPTDAPAHRRSRRAVSSPQPRRVRSAPVVGRPASHRPTRRMRAIAWIPAVLRRQRHHRSPPSAASGVRRDLTPPVPGDASPRRPGATLDAGPADFLEPITSPPPTQMPPRLLTRVRRSWLALRTEVEMPPREVANDESGPPEASHAHASHRRDLERPDESGRHRPSAAPPTASSDDAPVMVFFPTVGRQVGIAREAIPDQSAPSRGDAETTAGAHFPELGGAPQNPNSSRWSDPHDRWPTLPDDSALHEDPTPDAFATARSARVDAEQLGWMS